MAAAECKRGIDAAVAVLERVQPLAAHQRQQQLVLGDHQDAVGRKGAERGIQNPAEQPSAQRRARVDTQQCRKSGLIGMKRFGGNDSPAVQTQLTLNSVLARAGDSFKVNFTTSCVRKRFSSRATGWAVDRCGSSWIAALAQSAVEDRFRRNSTD